VVPERDGRRGGLLRKTLLAAGLLLAAVAFADTPSKSKAHGLSVTGTVVSFDGTAKKMTVKTPAGKQVPLVWTSATKTAGGAVKAGAKVTVRYLEKEGKNIATSIRIETVEPTSAGAPPAAATPTVTASGAPKAR
jgi:hypothetical protein